MPSCTSFPPHTPPQLLSSRRSGAEPCTAQRSGGGATSSFDLLKRALFHNALTVCGCPYFRYSDSSSASQSASALLQLAPKTAALASSPAHGGAAQRCAHRICECATNPESRTARASRKV